MDQDESPEKETSALDRARTVAEAALVVYGTIVVAKGLYDMGKEAKRIFKEKRQAKQELD